MTQLELAKELNNNYQQINTSRNWKIGNKEIVEWDKLPKTTQFVWIKMAEVMKVVFVRELFTHN